MSMKPAVKLRGMSQLVSIHRELQAVLNTAYVSSIKSAHLPHPNTELRGSLKTMSKTTGTTPGETTTHRRKHNPRMSRLGRKAHELLQRHDPLTVERLTQAFMDIEIATERHLKRKSKKDARRVQHALARRKDNND